MCNPRLHQSERFQGHHERLHGRQLQQEQHPRQGRQPRERQLQEQIQMEADYQFDQKAIILKSYRDYKGVFNCLQSLHCVNYILLSE